MRGKRRRKRTKKKIVFFIACSSRSGSFFVMEAGDCYQWFRADFTRSLLWIRDMAGSMEGREDPADLLEKHINLDTGLRLRDALERKSFSSGADKERMNRWKKKAL